MTTARPLAGRRILIVEDRYLIATEMAEEVGRLGGQILGPCRDVASAAKILEREAVDMALLDVNLDDEVVFPLAEALEEKGAPFLFLTGYDQELLPARWQGRPVISKPIDPRLLREELVRLTAAPG